MRLIPPSHRRRGATAVLARHKPQWHRHDRRGSTVVPSLIVVTPRKTDKTADLRGGTAATLNTFRRASAVLVPSHRRRGATAVLARHKPHWHRHDRRGSAVVPSVIAVAPRKTVKTADLRGDTAATLNTFRRASAVLVPSHRRRSATAVIARHKPQWHRHDRRGSAVVPSVIAVAPRKTVKTADLRGGTAATLNTFRRASAVLVPSHRRRSATAVLARHKPQWHRHDRRGSAVVPSVIAVASRKTVKTVDLRGGMAETLNMFKTSAGHRGLGQSAVGSPRHRHDRRGTTMTAVVPYKNRSSTAVQSRKSRMATLRRSRGGSTAVNV